MILNLYFASVITSLLTTYIGFKRVKKIFKKNDIYFFKPSYSKIIMLSTIPIINLINSFVIFQSSFLSEKTLCRIIEKAYEQK